MQNNLNLDPLINIEVAYAASSIEYEQSVIKLPVIDGINIQQAIELSGILSQHLEINLQINKVGIFGEIKDLSTIVKNGNRIEIYRNLYLQPNDVRILRTKNIVK